MSGKTRKGNEAVILCQYCLYDFGKRMSPRYGRDTIIGGPCTKCGYASRIVWQGTNEDYEELKND